MQKQNITGLVCRSRAMLRKCAEAGYNWASAKKEGIAGQVCRSWASVKKQFITGQVCKCNVLLGSCTELGCFCAGVPKQGIDGQVCRSATLLGKFADVRYCLENYAKAGYC